MSADEFAPGGWIVEVLIEHNGSPEARYFAVGAPNASEAEQEVKRYPGLHSDDRSKALRVLSPHEIAVTALRTGGVRPYPTFTGKPA